MVQINVESRPDVTIQNEGNLFLFGFQSDGAIAWARENVVTEGWQWLGSRGLAVDHRYARDLAQALLDEGFVVA